MNRIKILRKEKGLKQTELAAILNVTQGALSSWETGRYDIGNNELKKMADYFGVSIDYLLGNEPSENKKIPKDLKKILEDEEVTLNGRMMSAEDKEKMYKIIEAAFWEAKEMNKRKK